MSNRELLELAAKAGDIKGEYVSWCYNGFKEGIRELNDKSSIPWNPLTDDGPALRLAVKLKMDIVYDFDRVMVVYGDGDATLTTEYFYDLPTPTDQYAATRRAIVRAAAEIGKAST